jgi:hypothetical protein
MLVTSAVAVAGVPAELPQEFGVAIHVIFVATATYSTSQRYRKTSSPLDDTPAIQLKDCVFADG